MKFIFQHRPGFYYIRECWRFRSI